MEVKNALDLVHGGFVRSDEKRGVAGEENQGGATPTVIAMRPFIESALLIPPPENRTEAKKPSKTRYQIQRESDPGAVERRLLGEKRGGGFHGGDQQRRKNRKQQQRQQQFAHARVRGNGGKHGAGDDQADRAQHQHDDQPPDDSRERNVVENGEHRNENQLRRATRK